MSSNVAQGRPRDAARAAGARRVGVASRIVAAVPALAAGACGVFVAAHHPLLPGLAVAAFALVGALACRDRLLWLWLVPAVLPVFSYAPWTGWLTFEEIDLLVLAVVAGGYARRAVSPLPPRGAGDTRGLLRLGVAVLVVGTLVSMRRGFDDAGGFVFGWYEGYHESMNSLRIAKGPLLAVLLWPLWLDAVRAEPALASARLRSGLLLGLAAASLAAVWERAAFTSLLDFSSDYRTTALFWEMHVGGAAFDGFLALTLPFAVVALLDAGRVRGAIGAVLVVALGAYACLTTFSRGVYLAIPVGLVLLGGLRIAADRTPAGPDRRVDRGWAVSFLVAFVAAAVWMFPTSGYRGVIALLGAFAALLALARVPPGGSAAPRVLAVVFGLGLAGIGLVAGPWTAKGPYLAYAAAALLGAASVWALRRRAAAGGLAAGGLLAAAVWLVVAMVQVGGHWGGEAAAWRALPVGVVLFAAVLGVAALRAPWPSRPRWQAQVFGALVVAAGIVAVFSGGAYMGGRFSTSSDDFEVRLAHWREGVALLTSPGDWAFGRGLGRYPAADYIARLGEEHPGDYRLRAENGAEHLALVAGQQALGSGEVLRLSQRVGVPGPSPRVRLAVRAGQPVVLRLEVCEKHLLYTGDCQAAQWGVQAGRPDWQPVDVVLAGAPVTRGARWAPRQLVFSVGLETPGASAELRDLHLVGERGDELLANGDFRRGLAQWFFSSDRYHLPWHVKNMALNVLLDQGIVGVALVAALLGAALWRVGRGAARRHPLAPALAASLCGFLVVGLFDSLLDVPRVALLFYLLTFVAATLPADGPSRAPRATDLRR